MEKGHAGADDGLKGLEDYLGREQFSLLRQPCVLLKRGQSACKSLLVRPSPASPRILWTRGWWLRTLSVAVVAFLTIFGLEVVFKWMDPFGLHHASERHSTEMSARTLAPFYDSTAQDRIVVVLLDENTLRERGLSWPPPHAYYAEMLRRILRGQPRAVYVDLLTMDRRGTPDDLEAARESIGAEIAASDVPVMFAQVSPRKPGVFSGVPGLRFATAGWKRAEDAYPLSIAPAQVVGAREGLEVACDPATALPSVALSLYDVACRAPADGGALPSGCREPAGALADRCVPLWVVWGMRAPSALGGGINDVADCEPAKTAGNRWGLLLDMVWRDLWAGFSPEAFERGRERCPFAITIPEQKLGRDTVGLLRDRIVLVGAHLAGLDDSVASPVHSRLPGVYLHAMALDNLMHYGNAHPRPQEHATLWGLAIAALAALLVAIVLRARMSPFFTWAWLVAAGAFVTLAPIMALWCGLHYAPPNWLAMLAMILVVVVHARHRMHREAKALHAAAEAPGASLAGPEDRARSIMEKGEVR